MRHDLLERKTIPRKLFYKTVLISPKQLLPHEETRKESLDMVISLIKAYGGFRFPVLIDGNTLTILDGHHRVEAAIKLGLKFIPVFPVDYYKDEDVMVFPRRKEFRITKKSVVSRALKGILYPPKTTRHVFRRITFPSSNLSLSYTNGSKETYMRYPIIV